MLLVRHRERFSGRVLELGSGAGRVSGYLAELGASFHGIDVSTRMVEYCRARYPSGTFEVRDLRDLESFDDGAFDLVFAGYNILDVLEDAERRRVLAELHRIVAEGGTIVISTHNRASIPRIRPAGRIELTPDPFRLARRLAGAVLSIYHRRRLAGFERDEPSYAIRNDEAHRYRLLHYYIGRDEQERQLAEAGFALLECLDEDGRLVRPGEAAELSSELHYLATRT